ncbi:hypothetical protein PG993_012766 [Apiospora rasikravindrae]|uniref:DUF1740-domain-containing protein n=1 Tax=Apiospora rasikravindrae TaxID=990691 RepID=A0ABR1RVR5_9PEZI
MSSSKPGQKSSRVPTFSSFKPKTEATAAVVPANDQGRSDSTKEQEKKESHQLKEARSRGHHHHNSRYSGHRQHDEHGGRSDKKRSRHHEDERSPPSKESLDLPRRSAAAPSEFSSRDNFVVDKRGDPLIRRYGGNNRYDVPAYRRCGRGRILGADGFIRVEQLGSRDQFTIRGFYEGGGSALNNGRKHPLAGSRRTNSEVVRVRAEKAATYTGVEDFLPLGSSSSKKRRRPESDASGASSDEEEGPSYRSIHGKSKPHEFSDSDEEYGSDADGESRARDLDDPIKARTVQLSQHTRQHPEDIDAWLALVDHQDTLLHIKDRDGQRPTPAEIRSFADIKLSMLEKALSHCTSPEKREILLLRTMTEGAKIWDAKALAKRWEDVVRDHSSSFAIWKAYVDFRQTSLSALRYEDIKLLYINKMQQIKTALHAQGPEHIDQDLYAQLVIVFTRLTRFAAESGYCELAAASWQAILELHCCRPASIAEGDNNAMAVPSSFQRFWESEVPRIGEDSAKGWAAFDSNGGTEEPPEPIAFDNGTTLNTRDPYKAWATVERHRSSHARVPARTMDEGTEDDPYRVVMYTDIEDFLFFAPDGALQFVQEQLISAFLIFHQLPLAPNSGGLSDLLVRDGLLDANGLFHFGGKKQDLSETLETEGTSNKPLERPQSHQRISPSTEVLFPLTAAWFNYMDPAVRALTNDGQLQLVSNALKQLARSHGRGELAVYHLAFDICSAKTDGKKAAKALLKKYPTNIELYIGYANYEFCAGNETVACNVITAALQLPSLTYEEKQQLSLAWTWMALEQGDLTTSLSRLCLVGQESLSAVTEQASPALVLKTRQTLTSNCEYSTSQGNATVASVYAKALVLLQYLTQQSGKEPRGEGQGDIEAALAVVAKCSDEFKSRGLAGDAGHERLLQFAAQLLYVHISHGPYRPAFLREQTAVFLSFFPDNTMFLTLFAWKETRLSIDDRVRALLNGVVLTKPHDRATSRVFAIRHEMRSGNAHSTRAAFEHALEDSPGCKHNVGLWVSYIRYCRETKELRPKAKEVFYRAIQRCPWSKDVFMEAFGTLVRDLDSAELRSVYSTLYEKGLRVHVEMDEFVGRWKEEARQREQQSHSHRPAGSSRR